MNVFLKKLKKRADIISNIRNFFLELDVLEVETPTISNYRTTEVHLKSFKTFLVSEIEKKYSYKSRKKMWLITSPEYHMKRMIAKGSGAIYQICHSFRNGEIGNYHNPEFTILEWYRPEYNMFDLIEEVVSFLKIILGCKFVEKISYRDVYFNVVGIDPLFASKKDLIEKSKYFGIQNDIIFSNIKLKNEIEINNYLLELIFSLAVEPIIGMNNPLIVYHYPALQSQNSIINSDDSRLSNRFEVFFKGLELGNGCEELINFDNQKKIFENHNNFRKKLGLSVYPIDEFFVNSLKKINFLYSGIAIGIDRLIMVATKSKNINDVLTFPIKSS
ncbi:Elongation factor P--(R)-beta-lysine ligase [Buchnera aphidicola (Tetraneura ulmi)]|uniref:elongation factor P--(R)-beta-lysine ligase n=1 Tax=Buchnera aphidicola TaxID=9 RepID=UPI0034644D42